MVLGQFLKWGSLSPQRAQAKTCIKKSITHVVFHVVPCLWVLYFVVYVSNSAFGARRENMWVFGVVFGCLYLSCCSPCVLLANDINGNPDKVRPADYQLNWKMLAGWSPGVLFANDISWQTRHRETSWLPAGLKIAGRLVSWCLVC